MEEMSGDILESALRYRYACHVSCVPLVAGRKVPSVKNWDDFRSRLPSGDEIKHWPAGNLGILTGKLSGIVVVDCESKEDAVWFFNNRGRTDLIVETPRGFHFYFGHPGAEVLNAQRVADENGKPRYDVRGDGGYVVAPPSVVDSANSDVKVSGKYVWRSGADSSETLLSESWNLPKFDISWRPIKRSTSPERSKIVDGKSYIANIVARSGSGGHNDTWRAVNVLRESGLSEAEALAAMVEWNSTNAEPPWSIGELLHKVCDCYGE